jgi:hypothetical protein
MPVVDTGPRVSSPWSEAFEAGEHGRAPTIPQFSRARLVPRLKNKRGAMSVLAGFIADVAPRLAADDPRPISSLSATAGNSAGGILRMGLQDKGSSCARTDAARRRFGLPDVFEPARSRQMTNPSVKKAPVGASDPKQSQLGYRERRIHRLWKATRSAKNRSPSRGQGAAGRRCRIERSSPVSVHVRRDQDRPRRDRKCQNLGGPWRPHRRRLPLRQHPIDFLILNGEGVPGRRNGEHYASISGFAVLGRQ